MSMHQHDGSKDSIKDAKLLLPPSPWQRAPLQKIFIDDLTATNTLKRRRLWRVPWFILMMSFIQISLHYIVNECMQRRLIYKPESKHEYWRYFTYMLLHADAWHLWMNMCLQCFIGVCLELEQGHCRLGLVYITGGISGALANAWLKPELLLLGASAGVYAMLCSHVPHLVLNFSELSQRFVRLAVFLILLISDMAFTTFHYYINQNRNPRISLEAHLGGGIVGLLSGFIVYRRLKLSEYRLTNAKDTTNYSIP